MKDRWKIFWISVFLSLILAALFLFMGFSLRRVDLQNYGVLRYDYYDTVDTAQQPRTNGNYLVGLDHSFVEFPKGFIFHEFSIKTLTKDKSLIEIDGVYVGKLVYGSLIDLYFNYGEDYRNYLFSAVEELFHEAIEQFSLNQLVSNRAQVDQYVKNYVKSSIQMDYQWVQTKHLSLGSIKTSIPIKSLPPDTQIQQRYLSVINQTLSTQLKSNIYGSGGYELLKQLQKSHGELFYNISQQLKILTDKLSATPTEIIPAMEYVLNTDNLPLLDNKIEIQISR